MPVWSNGRTTDSRSVGSSSTLLMGVTKICSYRLSVRMLHFQCGEAGSTPARSITTATGRTAEAVVRKTTISGFNSRVAVQTKWVCGVTVAQLPPNQLVRVQILAHLLSVKILGCRLTVGQLILAQLIGVRIPAPQSYMGWWRNLVDVAGLDPVCCRFKSCPTHS